MSFDVYDASRTLAQCRGRFADVGLLSCLAKTCSDSSALINRRQQRYNLLSACTVLFFDHFVTFDDEVNLIWSQRQSIASILFLVSRYTTLVILPCYVLTAYPVWTVSAYFIQSLMGCPMIPWFYSCKAYISSMFPVIAPIMIFSLASWIMILRTYALYALNKRILIFLSVLWTITVGIMALAGTSFGKGLKIPDSMMASPGPCLLGRAVGPSFSVFWATPLVLDTTIFFLTIRKTGQLAKNRASPVPITSVGIMKVYLRDGTLYYAVVCLTHLVNFLATLVAPSGVKSLTGSFGQSLSTVLICRLVLSLRKEGKRNSRRRTTPDARTTVSEGVLSSCAIASFFHVDLESEPDSNGATRGTVEPSVVSADRDLERDMQSEGFDAVAMTVIRD